MARIRTIKPGFWKDEDLSDLPADTHLLAAGLLNYADDEGYFNANPALVQAECCPLRDLSVSVHESLKLLHASGYLQLGIAENGKRYGKVVTFDEHQRVNRPTPSKIKSLQITWEDSTKLHEQLTEPSPPEGKGKGKERKGREGNSMGQLPPAPDEFDARFEELRALYPKRSGHQRWPDAKKHIRARLREGHTWEEILDGARRYVAWVRATGKERMETVLQAATFVGENKGFLEAWDPPATKADARLSGNLQAAEEFKRRVAR